MTTAAKPRLTSLAPQSLADNLDDAIAFCRDVPGFAFGEPWGGFYAIVRRDGLERPNTDVSAVNRHKFVYVVRCLRGAIHG